MLSGAAEERASDGAGAAGASDPGFAEAPPVSEAPPLVEGMRYRLQIKESKERCALHKRMPKPVIGIITSVLGFR